MRSLDITASRILVLSAAFALAPAIAAAQETLPPASELIDRYVESVGGREALLSAEATRSVGTVEIPAAGLRGELEVVTVAPNSIATRVTIPGMGAMQSGFDGEVGWSVDPMTGARLLSGGELDVMRDQSNMLAAVRDASLFDSMETVDRTEIAGQPCYRVRFAWKSGRESVDCYHTETGLLVATSGSQETAMGSIDVLSRMEDYREFGDVLMPTRVVQEMMGMQQIMTISEVQVEDVDTSLIEPPAAIRTLIEARQ